MLKEVLKDNLLQIICFFKYIFQTYDLLQEHGFLLVSCYPGSL